MRFEASGSYVNGAADADPVAAPASVPDSHMLNLLKRQQDSDVDGRRILLALDAPVAETLTLDLWALDEDTFDGKADEPDLSTRKFYRFATGVVVTGTRITEVTAAVPPGGRVFARRTADALTTTRRLLATCVP